MAPTTSYSGWISELRDGQRLTMTIDGMTKEMTVVTLDLAKKAFEGAGLSLPDEPQNQSENLLDIGMDLILGPLPSNAPQGAENEGIGMTKFMYPEEIRETLRLRVAIILADKNYLRPASEQISTDEIWEREITQSQRERYISQSDAILAALAPYLHLPLYV